MRRIKYAPETLQALTSFPFGTVVLGYYSSLCTGTSAGKQGCPSRLLSCGVLRPVSGGSSMVLKGAISSALECNPFPGAPKGPCFLQRRLRGLNDAALGGT